MKKRIMVSAAALALSVMTIGGTLAYFTDKDTRDNVITMGNVRGTLTETKEKKRSDDTIGKDYDHIKPGDVLEKDPTVTLKKDSEDAYVRVKVNYEGLTKEQAIAIDQALDVQEGWIKAPDGYFYYNKILSNKKEGSRSSKVFTKVTIPVTWGNEIAGGNFEMNIQAEFIQAEHFTPVKDENGYIISWGDADIQKQTEAE